MVHTGPMTIDELQQRLRDPGFYETDGTRARTPIDRLFGRFDCWYYLNLFLIVRQGYRAARRNAFNNRTWSECSLRAVRNVERCGGTVHVDGGRAVAQIAGPAVFVANHMSMLETFILPVILLAYGGLTTIVKESLMRYPLFGSILTAVEPICVGRENPRDDLREVLERGGEHIRKGRSALLFPQATRSVPFVAAEFNSLGVKLAARAGVPVVPLALKTNFQGIGRHIRDFGGIDRTQPVRVCFGTPMAVSGNGRAQHEQSVRFLAEKLKSWSVPVLQSAAGDSVPRGAG